jgi:uncharacterized protein YbaP (TraB family)
LKFSANRLVPFIALAITCFLPRAAVALSCVWKVTGPNGGTVYLAGSMHALRSTDYPLPAAYNRAFDACSRLAFEDDPKESTQAAKAMLRAGTYPKGDSLRNHIDPRTYNYVRRFFALVNVPENQFSRFRPWFLDVMLSSPSWEHWQLGVERFLARRARANSKPISGLESSKEHNAVFADLSDRQAEAYLLILFINAGEIPDGDAITNAWRRGDVESLAHADHEAFRDFPSLHERFVDVRNRNWVPKIEGYLRSGKTYFVVVGAGHMGGPQGLLAMLRARGCTIEQL